MRHVLWFWKAFATFWPNVAFFPVTLYAQSPVFQWEIWMKWNEVKVNEREWRGKYPLQWFSFFICIFRGEMLELHGRILFKKHHVIIWETSLWVEGCDVNSPQYRWLAVYEYQCDGWRRVFIYVSIYRCRECKLGSRGVHWYWAGGRRREQVCVCPSVSLV